MRNAILMTSLAITIVTCTAFAQKPNPAAKAQDSESKVFIGQSLDDAKKALANRKIDFGGPLAIAKLDPEQDYLNAVIDKNHTFANIFYSKSKSQVTAITMRFRSHLQAPRGEHTWLSASQLILHEDRSNSVKFKPPLTDEEIKKLEENRPPLQVPPLNRK